MTYKEKIKQLLAFQQQHLVPEKNGETYLTYLAKENMSQGFCMWYK